MKTSSILGLNSRTQLYAYRYNSRRGKKIVDSKIQTEKVLSKVGVASPKIIKIFRDPNDILSFDWDSFPGQFALKPSRGLGGQGIVVVKQRLKSPNKPIWLTTQKEKVTTDDLKLHTLDILEGAYSMGNEPDVAFIQEYVGRHLAFKKWAYRGTPDIRVIVFNKVPVMAMLRLPTKESGGRANLHQGALGVGVDMATGITTKAIWHGEQIVFKPGTERRLRGIKIPDWDKVLMTAVEAQIASHLGYVGVDVVLHPEKGAMVLEMNAQPGLQIQLANIEGLKKRLERVEDLEVADAKHGVGIAKLLFAGRYQDTSQMEEGLKTIGTKELVRVVAPNGKKEEVWAKVDTGAWNSSIDKDLAKKLGLLSKDNVLWEKKVTTSMGSEKRPVINLRFYLAGRKVDTVGLIANRKGLRRSMIVGRRDLGGFLVKTEGFKK
jgi:alpha-L-glutamate ligase-like protein